MSKKKDDKNSEVIVDVQEVYSKTEHFVEENKQTISIVVGAIVIIVGLYFAYTKMYIAPMELEAQEQMFMAEKYFELDSLDKAINGDGINEGFIYIIDEYSGTKAANLAHYYLGICYLKQGEFEYAIDELKSFSSDDILISTVAIGATGDAYLELDDIDQAIKYYEKSAENNENKLTTPLYLFKAGLAHEDKGILLNSEGDIDAAKDEFAIASEKYTTIKKEYSESTEARSIEKYIARANALK